MNIEPPDDHKPPKIPGLDAAAIKAVRNSLPGKFLGRLAAFLALLVLLLGYIELADNVIADLGFLLSPDWLNKALLIGVPALVISAQLINEGRAERIRRLAVALAISPALVPEDYFRIGPYLDGKKSHDTFIRADRAHEKVLEWLRRSESIPLYLTGDSGSGKTSLLNAFVIPSLRKDGWTVSVVRVGQDAQEALTDALTIRGYQTVDLTRALVETAVRRCDNQLLIVLDHFEEFLVLGTAERQSFLDAMLDELNKNPIDGLKILLVVRSDYQTLLEETGLPRLLQGENFFQIGRFSEEAARTFFSRSKLNLKEDLLNRLLKSAAVLDDTPGMIRPITLNVLGYVLRQRGAALTPTVDAGALVRDYISQVIENPAIRAWAPQVLEGLLTEQGTKRPRQEADLAADTKLRTAEVRAVLHALGAAALARPLEATQGMWELSHDFVAHAVTRYLGRRRAALVRRAAAYAAPLLLALGIIIGLAAFEWHRLAPGMVRAELADQGILVETHKEGLSAGTTGTFEPSKLADSIPLLRTLSVISLDLSNTRVVDLESLKGMTTLRQLNLSKTPVVDLKPLQSLTALQQLDLSVTGAANLEPLKGLNALQQLTLSDSRVTNVEPLNGLTALQRLDLSNTGVTNLEPLKGLTALQQLDLVGTPVVDLEPLKSLAMLQELDLVRTPVVNLSPLQGLTALQQLDLSDTPAVNLEPLKGLTALRQLNLSRVRVVDLEPLKDLTTLQRLDLSETGAANLEALKGLTALQQLTLSNSRVTNLEPLRGLIALQELNLYEVQVANLEPLKDLTALQQLTLSGTPVVDLEPLKNLTALQQLNLARTPVADLKPLKGLTALQSLNLFGVQAANLEPLKNLTALQQLTLVGMPIVDLEPLKYLNALQQLDLAKTPVANLEPLNDLTAIQWLDLVGTPVADLEPLKGLSTLQRLNLSNTRVVDLKPLKGLTALQELNLSDTRVVDLEPLRDLAALQILELNGTHVPASELESIEQYRRRNGLLMIHDLQ